MRKRKLIVCFVAATAALAMAGFVAGCGAKDKFEQWTCDHEYNKLVYNSTEHWYECSCGEKQGESAHTYDNVVVVTEPTCVKTGLKTYTCVCGMKKQEKLSVTEHTPVTIEGKSPTCTEPGLTDGIACSVCETVLVEQTEIALLGHTPVTVEGTSPTCGEKGLTDGIACSVCDTVLVEQTAIAATGEHVDDNIDSYCDVCGNIDFTYYQDAANYITEEYTAWEDLGGRVARLHVASTADDGTVKDNSFSFVTTGVIGLYFDRESDSFVYTWCGYLSSMDNDGSFGDYYITHDDLQYYAFEVDGEYYVDVYFANDVTLSLCAGMTTDDIGENIQPYFTNVRLGDFDFPENTYTILLKNVHNCADSNADGTCDGCGLSTTVLSGNTYRMYLQGANYDNDMSNGYEAWGGAEVLLADVTNPDVIIKLNANDYTSVCFVEVQVGDYLLNVQLPGDCITMTYHVDSTSTEAYFEFYFVPNKDITLTNSDGETVTFNTDNLRVKSGKFILVEETEAD